MVTVKDLSYEEKIKLLCGKDFWHTEDLSGKLPAVSVSDGPVGLRTVKIEGGAEKTVPATAYPSVNVLANSWSTECARIYGEALSDDCAERGVDVLLAPGVNIKRTPENGRNFEYFSEDPYLAGTLAYEYVDGLQKSGTGACLKHYLANNLEYDRLHCTSEVDERTLREIYYKPFEIACKAKPRSVMCAYNLVNGVRASENKKGFNVLRNEFGFDGIIMSDWGAVRDRTASAAAGLDLEMPFNRENYEKLLSDFKAGKISEEEIDACAERMLNFIYKTAAESKARKIKRTAEERRAVSEKVYAEGVVLLKNNGLLPLSGKENISVCGCYAKPDEPQMLRGGGSAEVTRINFDFNIPSQLKKRTSGKVSFDGAFRYDGVECFSQNARTAVENAALSDVNIVCAGTGSHFEYEQGDRSSIKLPAVQERAIIETARQNPNTAVVIFAGSAVDVSAWEKYVAAIIYAGFPGENGDGVIADILFGRLNPCGKLSETFANSLEDIPSVNSYRSSSVTLYSEGLNVGYRYFDGKPAAYPFGHGLSYSDFVYGKLSLKACGGLDLEVGYEIHNASARAGKEISQLYVRECVPLVYRPYKELKGYSKDEIAAGGKKSVKIRLDKSAFAHWSTATDEWTADDGVYEIIIGASCGDVRLCAKIYIENGRITVL